MLVDVEEEIDIHVFNSCTAKQTLGYIACIFRVKVALMEYLHAYGVLLTVCKPMSAHGSSECHQVSMVHCDLLHPYNLLLRLANVPGIVLTQ